MDSALVIGGTRFIGRHLVEELLDCDYAVTLFTRGRHENPFADDPRVQRIEGDRTDDTDLRAAKLSVEPDAVFDCVAYHPSDVANAVDLFSDVEAYVYVSSAAAYGTEEIPLREDSTPLADCSDEQAADDTHESYGPRKAEGDRVVFEAATRGIRAMSVRPCVVYGPHDYTERLDYWLHRVDTSESVVVPGDGTNIQHRAYVEDVARALRIVAESGTAGEAYNVGDQRLLTLDDLVECAATAMDTDVDVVHAGERELEAGGLTGSDFPGYVEYPHILSTDKLTSLGWESTPISTAMARTASAYRENESGATDTGPARDAEQRVLDILDTF